MQGTRGLIFLKFNFFRGGGAAAPPAPPGYVPDQALYGIIKQCMSNVQLCRALALSLLFHFFVSVWIMINHSTLDCHVTFSTRSLAGPERLIDTLTL